MLYVQIIDFDYKLISIDSAKTIMQGIVRMYASGASYWSILKKYRNESCSFELGPLSGDKLLKRFGSSFEERTRDEIIMWNQESKEEKPCLIIIQEPAHKVPAFYSIAYNT